MGTRISYKPSWKRLVGGMQGEYVNPYAEAGLLCLGTKRHHKEYYGDPPEEEIVSVPFDKVRDKDGKIIDPSQREALNCLLLGGSGDGKCESGEGRVLLSDGSYPKIKNMAKQGQLISINQKTLKNEIKEYILEKNENKKECYKIKTQFGSEVVCSANHPFLTNKKQWKKLEEIKIGDFVATTRLINYFGNKNIDKKELIIMAYLIADGSLSHPHIIYTKKDKYLVRELKQCINKFGCSLKHKKDYTYSIKMVSKTRYQENPIKLLMEQYGLMYKKSVDKTIPKEIFSLNKTKLSLFLNRLFSSDGTIWRAKNRDKFRYFIQYCSGNKEMCIQIKHLLLRYGVIARFYSKLNKKYNKKYYYVEIQNVVMIKKFIEEINFFGEKKTRVDYWKKDIYSIKDNTNYDVVPIKKKGCYLGRKRAEKYDLELSSSDIFWDKVKHIKPIGKLDTYDLQVKDNENYISNNFILHNSLLMKLVWSILADAGYYVVYIDPKSFSAGWSSKPCNWKKSWWDKSRLPPGMIPKGIKLKHYIPSHRMEKFRKPRSMKVYSMKPFQLDKLQMWMCLNQTPLASDHILSILRDYKDANINQIAEMLFIKTENKNFPIQAYTSAEGKLILLKHSEVFTTKYQEINMLDDFEEGYSVCISYRSGDDAITCLDIGEKIYRCNDYSFFNNNKVPIIFFLDDASFFADTDKVKISDNFAVTQTKHIGYNYRSNGLCNFLAVQSLSIIDESVAESYPIKIISPMFNNYHSLNSIGVPQEAIDLLKYDELTIDEENKVMEWILIYKKKVYRFFPFLPPCNHFNDIYATENETTPIQVS